MKLKRPPLPKTTEEWFGFLLGAGIAFLVFALAAVAWVKIAVIVWEL